MITITDQNSKRIEETRELKNRYEFYKTNKISLKKCDYFKQANLLEYSTIHVSNDSLTTNNLRIHSGDIYCEKVL